MTAPLRKEFYGIKVARASVLWNLLRYQIEFILLVVFGIFKTSVEQENF